MYPMNEFQSMDIGPDPYERIQAKLRLVDVEFRCEVTPKLSILMSVFHRYSQLQRTLETLCRQNFKDFEVLIYDNQDDQDVQEVVWQFVPYLNIRYYKDYSAKVRHFDPSISFNFLFPHSRGEVVAIMQPECMLKENATYWLYYGHDCFETNENGKYISPAQNVNYYSIENAVEVPIKDQHGETCVTLKTLWSSPRMQSILDTVDWHTSFDNLYHLPDFWTEGCGLANFSNSVWCYDYKIQIWWLVFSFKRTASIWKDLPSLYGHAAIDLFMINYRDVMKYIDIMPYTPMAFHQDHHRMSISPMGEQDTVSRSSIQERFCK